MQTKNLIYEDMLSKSYKKVDIARKHYNCFLYFYHYDYYQKRNRALKKDDNFLTHLRWYYYFQDLIYYR
jgi:hypothetical protein